MQLVYIVDSIQLNKRFDSTGNAYMNSKKVVLT